MGKSDRLDDTELSAAQDALPVFAEAVWLLWSGNPPPAGDGGNGEGGGGTLSVPAVRAQLAPLPFVHSQRIQWFPGQPVGRPSRVFQALKSAVHEGQADLDSNTTTRPTRA